MSQSTHHATRGVAHCAEPTNPLRQFPIPAGAVRVEDWRLGPTGADGMPNVWRGFSGSSWVR
jgi:hypothetical protein